MKGRLSTSSASSTIQQEMNYCFDRDFFIKSKYILFAMAIASLYCLGYGIILFYEFRKMGILDLVRQLV